MHAIANAMESKLLRFGIPALAVRTALMNASGAPKHLNGQYVTDYNGIVIFLRNEKSSSKEFYSFTIKP